MRTGLGLGVTYDVDAEFLSSYSLSFDGSNDYIKIPSTGLSLNDWTMSCWVKVGSSNTATYPGILSTRSGSDNDYQTGVTIQLLEGSGGGYFYFDMEGNATDGHISEVSANTPTVGKWYHLAYTVDRDGGSGGVKQYVNGVLANTDTAVDNATSIDNIQIGARYYSSAIGQYFKGNLDEAALWDAVLSEKDIKGIYNNGMPNNLLLPGVYATDRTSNLKGWWRFEEVSGTSVADSSGNGNTGTISGASSGGGKQLPI